MKWVVIVLTFSVFSALAGYLVGIKSESVKNAKYSAKALRAGQSGFINPLLEYEVSGSVFGPALSSFEDDIQKLVDNLKKKYQANEVSVYFRNLNDGPWFGINQDINYFPASLLKLPIMLAYYKASESEPKVLDEKITYDEGYVKTLGNFNEEEYYKPEKTIEPKQTYTVSELIEKMIVYSDNNAKNLLVLNLDKPDMLYKLYTDLGLASPPELRSGGDVLTVHEYATFYRILYNASYLNKEDSNKVLELLSRSNFNRGINAGVPDNIKVAHKFGEHSDNNFRQLHDCGIIYYPQNPYILCIMTRGAVFDELEKIIGEISKSVYEHVDKQTKAGQM